MRSGAVRGGSVRLWFPELCSGAVSAMRPGNIYARKMSTAAKLAGSYQQRTVAHPIKFEGIGLHSGLQCMMTLLPAKANTGIVFCSAPRDETELGSSVVASWDRVIDTTLSTVIAGPSPHNWGRWTQQLGYRMQRFGLRSVGLQLCGPSFATIEHLMASLSGERIDNVRVVLSSTELPVMDGSSADFTAALSEPSAISFCAEEDADSIATVVEVMRKVTVEAKGGRTASLLPWRDEDRARSDRDELVISVDIDFGARIKDGAGGRQQCTFERREFAAAGVAERAGSRCADSGWGSTDVDSGEGAAAGARTFCFEEEVAAMRRVGLALGGSLGNAVVFDGGGRALNPAGLRSPDEPARHKALDALGDLALGGHLVGEFAAVRPGHALNHALLAALFSDPANYSRRPARALHA